MRFRKFDDRLVIRLEKGEEVLPSLLGLLAEQGITLGSFTALGALSRIVLGHYSLNTKKYTYKTIEGELEVASMVGNVAMMNGKPIIHGHVVVTGNDFLAHGGHLQEATVAATLEISLQTLTGSVERAFDDDIGLNLLQV